MMDKLFKLTIHTKDSECIVSAKDEESAAEKYWNNEIDEWISFEGVRQPEVIVEEII